MSSHPINIPTIGAAQPHLFIATTAPTTLNNLTIISSPTMMSAGSSSSSFVVSDASPVSSVGDDAGLLGGVNGVAKIESPLDEAEAAAAALKKHKPHKCDVCGASFARKVHLQRHSLRHQVCKPYSCERCGKCFSRQDSLVRHHRLLHEGGRDGGVVSAMASGVSSKKLIASPSKKQSSTIGRKMSTAAVFSSPVTYSPSSVSSSSSSSTSLSSSAALTTSPRCLRCSSVGVACDGKQPCAPCAANNGGRACCYTGVSAMLRRNRERQDSAATSSTTVSLNTPEDDESDSNPWNARRDTASSVASSTIADLTSPMLHSFNGLGLDFSGQLQHTTPVHQHQPLIYRANSFGMPLAMQQQQDHFFGQGAGGIPDLSYLQHAGQLKSALEEQQQQMYDGGLLQAAALQSAAYSYPLLQSFLPMAAAASAQQATFDYNVTAAAAADNADAAVHASSMYAPSQQQHDAVAALSVFDWAAAANGVSQQQMDKMPFSGTASDKSLSATLFSDDMASQQHSPAIHSTLMATAALPNSSNDYTQLGLHIPSQHATPLHLPLSSTHLDTNHWDGLIRTLSSSNAVNRPFVGAETVMV